MEYLTYTFTSATRAQQGRRLLELRGWKASFAFEDEGQWRLLVIKPV